MAGAARPRLVRVHKPLLATSVRPFAPLPSPPPLPTTTHPSTRRRRALPRQCRSPGGRGLRRVRPHPARVRARREAGAALWPGAVGREGLVRRCVRVCAWPADLPVLPRLLGPGGGSLSHPPRRDNPYSSPPVLPPARPAPRSPPGPVARLPGRFRAAGERAVGQWPRLATAAGRWRRSAARTHPCPSTFAAAQPSTPADPSARCARARRWCAARWWPPATPSAASSAPAWRPTIRVWWRAWYCSTARVGVARAGPVASGGGHGKRLGDGRAESALLPGSCLFPSPRHAPACRCPPAGQLVEGYTPPPGPPAASPPPPFVVDAVSRVRGGAGWGEPWAGLLGRRAGAGACPLASGLLLGTVGDPTAPAVLRPAATRPPTHPAPNLLTQGLFSFLEGDVANQLRRVYPVRPQRADAWLGREIARAARDPGALGVFR